MHGFDPKYSKVVDKYTTPTSEFYDNADGTGTLVLSPAPVRFKAKDGSWRSIDMTLVPGSDGSLQPRSAQTLPRIDVEQGLAALRLPTPAGDIVVRHAGLPVDAARPLRQAPPAGVPAGSAAALAALRRNVARLAVAGGVQVRYEVLRDRVVDDLVLPSASAGSSFTVTLTLPKGMSARQASDGVDLVDSTGVVWAAYVGGEAADAVAAAADDVAPAGTTTPVSVTLVSQGRGAATLRVSVDPAWLGSPDRVFPVLVDPTLVEKQTTESFDDLYLNSDNPDGLTPTGGADQYPDGSYIPYVYQDHLRLGNRVGAGTARIFLPFDDANGTTPFYVPIGDAYANWAELVLYQQDEATSCTTDAGVYDITQSWTPSQTTWNLQPSLDNQGAAYLWSQQPAAPLDGWQLVKLDDTGTGRVSFDVTKAMGQIFNGSGWGWHGLELSPNPESFNAVTCWQEFDSADYSSAYAPTLYVEYNQPDPPTATSGDNGSVPSQSNLDDPVDVATGNLKDPATDLASPAGVYGLEWARTYNSYDAENSVAPSGLGLGWSSSFSPRIQAVTGGVQMTGPDGRKVTWTSTSSGFARPFEYPADLAIVNGDYRVSFDDGSYWDFDDLGRLAGMTAADGQTVSINRNSAGQPSTVVSSTGAQLSFSYGSSGDSAGRITSVSGPAGAVGYGYDAAGDLTSVTDVGGNTTTYSYDSANRLVSITDPTGVVEITNSFDSSGRVATQTHASGGTTSFSYGAYDDTLGLWQTVVTDSVTGASGMVTFFWNADKEVVRVEDNLPNPSGGTGNIVLRDFADSLGDLTSTTSRLGGQELLSYDDANHMTCDAQPGATCPAAGAALDSGAGAYTAYAYDSQGRVVRQYAAGSGTTSYTYTGTDRSPTTVTDGAGNVTRYLVSDGLVMQETDPDGVSTSYTYDVAGRVLTTTVDGATTSYTYDAAGRQTCVAQPGGTCPNADGSGGSGSYTTTSYFPSGLVKSTRAADGGVTSYTYDSAGRLLTTTDPAGATTTNHYDPTSGLLMSVDKPTHVAGGVQQYATTHYAYDANGNRTCVAPPGGACPDASGNGGVEPYELTAHGALGRVLSTTNELGQTTRYAYNADGDKIETINPDGSVVKAAYDAAGRLYCTTAPGASASAVNCPGLDGMGGVGRYTITRYDSYGHVSCVAQSGGDCDAGTGPITTYTYDSLGRQHTVTDVNGGATTTTYTAGGRVSQVTGPDGGVTSYGYDAAGRRASVTDPDGGVSSTTYTGQGWVASTTDPTGLTTSYGYDAAGRQTSITAPDGVVTTRTYTTRGELATQQVGSDGTVSYTYNADGTVASVTDALGNTTSYSYDARGNRTVRTDAAGNQQKWVYDEANELVRKADQLNRVTATTYYDDATDGHKVVTSDPSGRAKTSVFNPDGTVVSTSYADPAGGLTYTYSYDALAHLTSVSDGTNTWSYSHNAAGELTGETTPGGSSTSWSYDATSRRTSMTYPDGAQVGYAYDKAGRLIEQTVTPPGGQPQPAASYSYDKAGRLLSATLPDGSRSYSYGTTGPGAGKVVGYSQTLPGATLTASLVYDDNGRLASQTVSTGTTTPTVAAGQWHSLALKPDGTVWAWGENGYGQLGDATTTSSTVPVRVPSLAGVTSVAAGVFHSVALRSDGTVWAWGDNFHGQLGDGTTTNSAVPLQVPRLTGVVAVAAGYEYSLALKADGTVWAWGYNADHELGDGASTADSLVPVQVQGLAGVTAVAGGVVHALALASDGTVWAWGKGDNGELGDNTTSNSGTPVQVVGLSGVTQVSAGNHLSLALKSDGSVWAWGEGDFGELGDQAWSDSPVPVQVSGLAGVRAVAAGYYHALALAGDGSVWAWGDDSSGELGIGSSSDMWSVPVRAHNLDGPSQLAAGYSDSFALQGDDVALAWGYDGHGELGIGSTSDLHTPDFDGYATIQAEDFSYGAGTGVKVASTSDSSGGSEVDALKDGDWLAYGQVDFGADTAGVVSFSARVASGSAAGGSIGVHLDSATGPLVATLPVADTGGWGSWVTSTVSATAVTGNHTVVLDFATGSNKAFVDLNWFTFGQGAISTSLTTSYSYDAAGQLVSETPSNGPATTYRYDGLGHRVSATTGGVTTTYAYDAAGELCWSATDATRGDCASPPSGATTYSYDAAGRLLVQSSDGTHSTGYAYDVAGRLHTLHLVDGSFDTTQTRAYNPGGDLTGITNSGSSTTVAGFVWDDTAALPTLAAQTAGGSTTDLVPGGAGWAAALLPGGQLAGIGLDALGDVVPTTATVGLAAAGDGYDAWGTPTLSGPSLEPSLGYRGELQFGADVDLRARDYDTALGAFTSVDPLDGVNGTTTIAAAYPYADNNPIANTDPTGQSATDYNAFVWNGRYDTYAKEHSPANGAMWRTSSFGVPVIPGQGTVRIGFFINEHLQCPLALLCLGGDGRDFDSQSFPAENRVFIYANFDTGTGYLFVNYSCKKFHDDCKTANPITSSVLNTRTLHSRLDISIHATNSWYPTTSPAIDASLALYPISGGPGLCLAGTMDTFPSFEAYQDLDGGRTITLFRNRESWLGPVALAPVAGKIIMECVPGYGTIDVS